VYLIDTNVWLERLLDHPQATAVEQFLAHTPTTALFLTDFAFHSLAIILLRLKKPTLWRTFLHDTMIDGHVGLLSVLPQEMLRLNEVMDAYGLDFDDAYQYTAAETHDLTVISYDTDFDRTPRGRKTPSDFL